MKPYKYTTYCVECDEELTYEISFGYPAPPCSNPDSPAYSDPGAPDEVEGPEECPKCGRPVDMDTVIEDAGQQADDESEARYEDEMERRAELARERDWDDD